MAPPRPRMRAGTMIAAASIALLHVAAVQANPQGGTVQAGSASIIQQSATRLNVIQQSDKAVIDWRSFSIAPGETTNFQQPSSGSWVLNRVTGSQASQLQGTLSANGRVLLINPNGVLIGPTATIDVAGLAATTADIRDDDFMAGRMYFGQASPEGATVVNQGRITIADTGFAALVAPGVQNSGIITARLGKVSLAGGRTFTLDLDGDNLVKIAVDGDVLQQVLGLDGRQLDALVDNTGRIGAAGGVIQMTAQAAKTLAQASIHQAGTLEAQTYRTVPGAIILDGGSNGKVLADGTVDASGRNPGETGGTVKVLGDKVVLTDHARIDVSGYSGGGTALIGGDFHGAGPEHNATATTVAPNATITADAIGAGDGGRVAIWSDDTTRFAGTVTARGGAQGGDGGFVETSGKNTLAYTGNVDLRAAKGNRGGLLLDPGTITVVAGAANSAPDDGQLAGGSIAALTNGLAPFTLSNGKIVAMLDNADVTLWAQTSIAVNAVIDASLNAGNGNLSLNAPAITLSANVTTKGTQTYAGAVTLGNDIALTTTANNGSLVFTGAVNGGQTLTLATNGSGTVSFGGLVGEGGAALTSLSVTAGTINLSGGSATTGVKTTNGQTYSGPVTLGTDNKLTDAGGTIDFASTVDGAEALAVSNPTGTVTFDGVVGGSVALNSLAVTAGTVNLSGGSATTGVKTTNGQTYSGPVTLGTDNKLTDAGGTIDFASTVDGAKALAVSNPTGTVTFGGLVGEGGAALTSLAVTAGTINLNGGSATTGVKTTNGQTYTGPVTLLSAETLTTTGNGTILFSGPASTVNGNFDLKVTDSGGAGTVEFDGVVGGFAPLNSLAVTAGAIKLDSDSITARSDIALSGTTTFSHALTLTADSIETLGSIEPQSTPLDLTLTAVGGSVTLGTVRNVARLGVTANTVTFTGDADVDNLWMPEATINFSGARPTLRAESGDIALKRIVAEQSIVSLYAGGAVNNGNKGGAVSVDVLGLIVGVHDTSWFTGQVANHSRRQGARRVVVADYSVGKVLFDGYPAIFSLSGSVDTLAMSEAMSQVVRFDEVTRYDARGTQKSPAESAFTNDILVAPYPLELFTADYDLITPTSGSMSYQGLSYFSRGFWDRISNRVDERHLRVIEPRAPFKDGGAPP